MALILEDIEKLVSAYEAEYAPAPGQPSSFWDRNKGKIMLGGGLLGLGYLGATGGLGKHIQTGISGAKSWVGQGLSGLGNNMNNQAAAPVAQATAAPSAVGNFVANYKKGLAALTGRQ